MSGRLVAVLLAALTGGTSLFDGGRRRAQPGTGSTTHPTGGRPASSTTTAATARRPPPAAPAPPAEASSTTVTTGPTVRPSRPARPAPPPPGCSSPGPRAPGSPGRPAARPTAGCGPGVAVSYDAVDGRWARVLTPCENRAWVRLSDGTAVPTAEVVLDAGHGGDEPGAVGPGGLTEKELNLAVVERTVAACVRARASMPPSPGPLTTG